MDSSLLVGSSVNSQSSYGAKLDPWPGFVTGARLVADSESTTRLDFVTPKRLWFSIL